MCHNCHKEGHFARECPIPSQRTQAFKSDPTYHLGEESTEGDNALGNGSESIDMGNAVIEVEETAVNDQYYGTGELETEDAFMTRWWEENEIWMVSDLTKSLELPQSNDNQNCSTRSIFALIDSGASSNVVGINWLQRYSSLTCDQWTKCYTISHRRFRFGDGLAVFSLGPIILNTRICCRDKQERPF